MSNIFLKNDLNDIFNSITESNISLPEWITIVDQANNSVGPLSATSTNINQTAGTLSATSTNINQNGGAYSATSNSNNIKDANQLISMLTSDSSSNTFKGLSETSTASLEQQLRDILKQDGGSRKNKLQKGGNNNIKADDVKNFFMDLKSQGVNVDVKLNNLSLSEFFNNEHLQTTTELNLTSETPQPQQSGGAKRKKSKKASKKKSQKGGNDDQDGGAKRKSKKASKKKSQKGGNDDQDGGAKRKSKKTSKKKSQKGGVNESFQALIKLRKAISEKLGIPNGVPAMKIASSLVKEIKEGNASMDTAQAAKQVMDKLKDSKYVEHAKQMLK